MSKPSDADSWRSFWGFQAFTASFFWLFSVLAISHFPEGVVHPPFGIAVLMGLVGAAGYLVVATILRAITGRNTGIGLIYLAPFGVAITHVDYSRPFLEILGQKALVFLVLLIFMICCSIFLRIWTARKPKARPSLMFDHEIDKSIN